MHIQLQGITIWIYIPAFHVVYVCSAKVLMTETMCFFPTETEKPWPTIAYIISCTSPPPYPTAEHLAMGTQVHTLALHCYISLYTYHNKLTGLCIGAWCWLCAGGLRSSGPKLQSTYNLVIRGVHLICAGWARTMCLCKLLSDCSAGTPCKTS